MSKKWFQMFLAASIGGFFSSGLAMAAGNVRVALEGSLLVVTGDNLDNSIEFIESIDPNTRLPRITVTGVSNTLINGRPSATFAGVSLNATEIRMERGNDSVLVRDVGLGNDLYVSLGDGNDILTLDGCLIGNNATIECGLGDDRVTCIGAGDPMLADVGQELFIDGGLGRLTSSVQRMVVGSNLSIVSDELADSVRVQDSFASSGLMIETKGGADTVEISSSLALLVMVNADAGADIVTLTGVTALEDVGVFTGIGNDRVTLTRTGAGKNIVVSLDAGNDSLTGTDVSATEDAIFEGGAGTDTLTNRGIRGRKVEFKEFEVRR